MNIAYKATIRYNNGDYCEWTEWYEKSSVWYSKRELAEKHLPELEKFRKEMLEYALTQDASYQTFFKITEPTIETIGICDEFNEELKTENC
jgi:hypothetical protein